ncbi:MAG: NUDIX hydrolase [Caulobacteraceae bacterium]|nr:NUDIX hydrolase [Caulobacteraceae bacterium]
MTPVEPRLACTVLLVRDRGGLEVLMVERHEQSHFASALVFPGGLVGPDDSASVWDELTDGGAHLEAEERSVRIAGYRELYEETGVLLAETPNAAAWRPHSPGERQLMEAVKTLGVRLDLDAMHAFAHWITPDFAPRRFDTHFRICGLDTGHVAISDGAETVSAEWISPKLALEMGAAGERKLVFPTRLNLELLAQSSSAEEAIETSRRRTIVTVSPKRERRPEGVFLVIPPDAGYGPAEQKLDAP